MPATSPKQQRYMAMCAHANHPPSRCPNRKVAREFSHKPPGGYAKGGKQGKRR